MKFTVAKSHILSGVLIAERITGKKESLPVLSCVVITADKDVSLKATNLEAGIEVIVGAEVQEKGTVAIPAAILSQTLRSIMADKITFTLEEGNLLIESRGTKTLIKSVPQEEFPALTASVVAKGIEIAREGLLKAVQAVSYAASPSMIRPDLGSIFLMIKNGALVSVATDSFRLAEKTLTNIGSKMEGDLLIPLKHALELVHILEHIEDDTVTLSIDDSQLTVVGGGTRFSSRVVEAQFPNYKEIVPKQATSEATMLKSDFAEMLRKARVFSGQDMHVGLHVYPKKKIFTATARSNEVGEMSDSIDAALSGDDLDINFHIGYLADCLSSIQSDSITLAFAGPGKPLVIRGASDSTFMYLVMPLNR